MTRLFFIWHFIFLASIGERITFAQSQTNYIQEFEDEFHIVNYPNEFLPGWFGNELRNGSSRIFHSPTLGKNNSKALAVQPISTFNAIVFIRLNQESLTNPKVRFWARSVKNGSGNRSAEVYYSWSEKSDSGYQQSTLLGDENEFANEDQEFRQFELELPDSLKAHENIFLRLEIKYGPGAGTCSRWIMDDFEFGDFVDDKMPPDLISVLGYSENSIQVEFSEAVDPVFSEFSISYKLNDLEPIQAKLISDSLVYLTFDRNLDNGLEYTLQVSQIPDLAGNFLQDTTVTFQYFDPTNLSPKTLVINEIMPAPKADLDLPNVEYVELFHAGEYAIRLGGVTWSNSKSTVSLPDEWINPGEFLILAPEKQSEQINEYGRVIPFKNWPVLLNSKDQLTLKNIHNQVIDQLSYNTSSWSGSEFANGGYSLEVVNPFYACNQSELLLPSKDHSRGTPGRQNSVLDLSPDHESPSLVSTSFESSTVLILNFSEPIFPDFSESRFTFSPTLLIDTVYFASASTLKIHFAEEIKENELTQLRIEGVMDCAGNAFVQINPIELILPKQAEKGHLFLHELLFNPNTGSPKFVELINVTDFYLEVGNWKLANLGTDGQPDQIKNLSEKSLIIPPQGIIAFTTNPDQLKLDYPKSPIERLFKMSTLPSFPIGGGTVVLMDSKEAIVEQFSYSDDLHHPLLRNSKGVSIERLSTQSPVNLASNWHSASSNEEYATPGRKNSQLLTEDLHGQMIAIEPEVFDPEGSNGNTFTTIKYQLTQTGWTGTFKIYSISGQLIQVLAQNELLGTKGLFTWTGTDAQGKIVRTGYYILTVELYNLSGEVIKLKKTVIVATKF